MVRISFALVEQIEKELKYFSKSFIRSTQLRRDVIVWFT
jgi:hypothetical protein